MPCKYKKYKKLKTGSLPSPKKIAKKGNAAVKGLVKKKLVGKK